MALPYPHGVGAGQIGQAANISTSPITGTAKGMLVGPNDDAISALVNRGIYAVNANVNYLYGLLGTDRAVLEVAAYTAAGGGDANQQIIGDIFVGLNTYTDASQAVQILDADGNELLLDGDKIVAIDIQNPLGVSIFPPAVGSEFSTDPFVVFGYEITGGAATIPANVDYQIVYGKAADLESAAIDDLVRVPIQHAQEGDVGEAKAFGHSTENAVIGARPALTWVDRAQAAGGCYIQWTAFWCLVDGRIRYVAAGDTSATGVNNNNSATFYVDCWGTVQVTTTGGAVAPGVSTEDYMLLGYGSVGVDVWTDTADANRSLGQKIPYITVGTSSEDKVNFESLQDAVDFVGYMYNSTLDSVFFPAVDSSELPRIIIVSGITLTATVTFRSPVTIEGAMLHAGFVSGDRNPQIFFDFNVGDVIDCSQYTVVAKDLQVTYTGVGAGRTDFLFGNAGANSLFERINGGSDNPALSFGGAFEITGSNSVVRDCGFSQIGATVGIYLHNVAGAPNNAVVDHTSLVVLAGAAGQMLYADDVSGAVITNSTLNGGAAGIGVMLNATVGLKLRDCAITGIQPFSTGGAGLALEVSDCTITGNTTVLAVDSLVMRGRTIIAGNFTVAGATLDIADVTTTGSIAATLNAAGHVAIDRCLVTPATATTGYGIQVTLDSGVGVVGDYLHIRGNRVTAVFAAGGPATYAGINVLWTSSGVDVEDISDNVVVMETDSGAATGFNGICSVSFPVSLLRMSGNIVETTITGAFAAAVSYGMAVVQAAGAQCRAEVDNNQVTVEGDSSATCSWAQVLSRPIGIALLPDVSTVFRVWVRGNRVRMPQNTVATPPLNETCTGIYTAEVERGFFADNEIYPAYRGLVVMPASDVSGELKFESNDVNFGHCEDADAGTWYDSGAGIVAGMYDGATHYYFDSIIMVGNRVKSSGVSDAAETRHCVHGHVLATTGLVVFTGNTVIDGNAYSGGGGTMYSWQFYEGIAGPGGTLITSTQFRPSIAGPATDAGNHNHAQTAGAMTSDPV